MILGINSRKMKIYVHIKTCIYRSLISNNPKLESTQISFKGELLKQQQQQQL